MKKLGIYLFCCTLLLFAVGSAWACDKKEKEIFFELLKEEMTLSVGEVGDVEYVLLVDDEKSEDEIGITTSDSNIVSVENGRLKGKTAGHAKVLCSYKTEVRELSVNVVSEPIGYLVEFEKDEYFFYPEEDAAVSAVVSKNGVKTDECATYVSYDTEIAEIDENGRLNLKSVGKVLIGAEYKSAYDVCTVYVETYGGVGLDKNYLKTAVGGKIELTADFENGEIVWSSDNENVAKVDDGVVTAVGEGKTNVYARRGSAYARCEVEVFGKAIYTVSDFFAIDSDLEASYCLMNDLDFEGVAYKPIAHYAVVGAANGFKGVFDGCGHSLKNIDLSSVKEFGDSNAVFGVLSGGTVKNVNVIGLKGENLKYSGGICNINSGSVYDCFVKPAKIFSADNTSYAFGGIANQNRGTIKNCIVDYSEAQLSGNIAGLCVRIYTNVTYRDCIVYCGRNNVEKVIFNENNISVKLENVYVADTITDVYENLPISFTENWVTDENRMELPLLKHFN